MRDGFNWYSYCSGNPVSFVDRDGLEMKLKNWPFGLKLGYDFSKYNIEETRLFGNNTVASVVKLKCHKTCIEVIVKLS